jgi:phosphopantothenoylcysteine decarboxylase/phosphopantothenate--cysteine ligase
MSKKEVIIGVTGSVAAYKACDVIRRLRNAGCNTTVVMTKEAAEFVTPLLMQQMSCNRVYADMFNAPDVWDPLHISLAQKADLVVIAPATANIIAKLASGICDDIVTCLVISTKAPVLIAPAMNENMYNHKATQDNIKRLKSFGYKFVGPRKGRLACGMTGTGHIADTDEIVKTAEKLLRQ